MRAVQEAEGPRARAVTGSEAHRGRRRFTVLAFAAIAGVIPQARAATYTYTPPGVSNTSGTADAWSTGTNWDATPLSAPDTTLIFNTQATGGITRFTNNDVAGNFQLNVMTVQGAGPSSSTTATLNITGNPLAFTTNGGADPVINLTATRVDTNTANVTTVSNALVLNNNLTIQGSGNATFSFNGNVSGTGTISKQGSSGVTFGGTTAVPGNLSVSAGTFKLGAANSISSTSAITVSGTGLLDFNTKAQTIGSLSLSGTGLFNNTAAAITVNGSLTNNSTSTGGSGAAFVVNSGGKFTVNGLASFGAGSTTLVGGGNGTQLIFNGGVSLTGAQVKFNNGTNSRMVLNGDVTTNDPGTAASSGFVINSGTANLLDLGNTLRTFNVANGAASTDFTVGMVVENGTGAASATLQKTGAGTMALTNAGSSYTGGTLVVGGTLAAQANNALGTGGVTVTPGAAANTILDLSSTNVTTSAIADAATLTLSSAAGGGGTVYGQVAFGANAINEVVGALVVDGAAEPAGTYTATSLPNFITGTGSITVVPEPAGFALAMAAGAGLALRRRVKRRR